MKTMVKRDLQLQIFSTCVDLIFLTKQNVEGLRKHVMYPAGFQPITFTSTNEKV
jgi:hypothetical protein